MSEMAVLTPCYRGDAAMFPELHRSVLEFTPEDTIHHVYVPARDKHLFTQFEGPRCRVYTRSDILPSYYLRPPLTDVYVNVRRPWPPLRGWVMQQTVKIEAAARLDVDVVLIIDSDVVLVRPTTAKRFVSDGRLCLYREENGVTADMERHVIWHRVARELLGLPPAPPPPLPDYVTPLNFWDPAIVRAMQRHITETTGMNWIDAFNAQLHISEFILYGVFVDEVLSSPGTRPPGDISICHNNWKRSPLGLDEAIAFADRLPPEAVAMMISAKSKTSDDVRLAANRYATTLAAAD
ncbi:DUF6492 family protein [Thermopolyspora sp. NPDC052614]|uniref:DUF6492 family protein n=1 Tax=Thermopolyspora sp. NPDC052614 TaxID=3155682 RepID=UPI003440D14D